MMQILPEGLVDAVDAQNGVNLKKVVLVYIPLIKRKELPGMLQLAFKGE